jgi:flagellar basal-body rod modification protein FlgD
MSTTTATSPFSFNTTGANAAANSVANASNASAQEQSDRFLKLLVTQMQNQDPLNPLDNSQVTSQMAQISTVSGIQTLNSTVSGLNSQFLQLQTMQGAGLVGHDVALQGSALRQRSGVGDGGFELASPADSVKVQVTTPDGTVVNTIDLKAQTAGRHSFNWNVPSSLQGSNLSFKVLATAGGKDVSSVALQNASINAVSTVNNSLALELSSGDRVPYDAVWAFL